MWTREGILATKRHEGTSGGGRNALYLDCGGSYPGVSLKKELLKQFFPSLTPLIY